MHVLPFFFKFPMNNVRHPHRMLLHVVMTENEPIKHNWRQARAAAATAATM